MARARSSTFFHFGMHALSSCCQCVYGGEISKRPLVRAVAKSADDRIQQLHCRLLASRTKQVRLLLDCLGSGKPPGRAWQTATIPRMPRACIAQDLLPSHFQIALYATRHFRMRQVTACASHLARIQVVVRQTAWSQRLFICMINIHQHAHLN